jgi:hypothetical protein
LSDFDCAGSLNFTDAAPELVKMFCQSVVVLWQPLALEQ